MFIHDFLEIYDENNHEMSSDNISQSTVKGDAPNNLK